MNIAELLHVAPPRFAIHTMSRSMSMHVATNTLDGVSPFLAVWID